MTIVPLLPTICFGHFNGTNGFGRCTPVHLEIPCTNYLFERLVDFLEIAIRGLRDDEVDKEKDEDITNEPYIFIFTAFKWS